MAELPAKPHSVMLVCGEPSGDQLGGELMAGLKALEPSIVITGVGGAAMAAHCLQMLFPPSATAADGARGARSLASPCSYPRRAGAR